MGRQWGAHYEIDLAGIDVHGRFTVLGECKWSRRKVGLSVLRNLWAVVEKESLVLSSSIQWVLFSRSGFAKDLEHLAGEDARTRLISSIF